MLRNQVLLLVSWYGSVWYKRNITTKGKVFIGSVGLSSLTTEVVMSTQAKVGLVGVVLFILVVSVVWDRSDVLTNATFQLELEMERYYNSASEKAAETSLQMMQPYLEPEDKGRFAQRMDTMREFPRMPHDSYKEIIWDVMQELGNWSTRRLQEQGERRAISHQMAWEALTGEPVCQKLTDLYNGLGRVEQIYGELSYRSEKRPKSLEEVEAIRIRFNEQKMLMDALLAQGE